MDHEALPDGIECRRAYADILRQATHPDTPHALTSKFDGQPCLIECGILIAIEAHALADENDVVGQAQCRVEPCARRVLDTVDRPLAAELPEAQMLAGMPVARR